MLTGRINFSSQAANKLPVLDSVPDFVYEITQTPANLQQAEQYLSVLKTELKNIKVQMLHSFNEISYQFNGSNQGYQQWRRRLIRAKWTKQNQILLIRFWLAENRPTPIASAQPKSDQVERLQEALRNAHQRISNLKGATLIDARALARSRRETRFLRASIADLGVIVLSAIAGGVVDENAIANLEALLERLTDADIKVQGVQADLKMTA